MEKEISVKKKVTIEDIANALGCSKTTVSRSLSGKGRIGEETRRKILEYAKSCDYRPNAAAKALAEQKTFNIGVVLPNDADLNEMPFFQNCLMGICERAESKANDVLVVMAGAEDITGLVRIVENGKVDGIILTRSLQQDGLVRYLEGKKIPFVMIGSSADPGVIQVDNHHIDACREMTSYLLQRMKRVALIGGNSAYMVNQSRYQGFLEGFELQGKKVRKDLLFLNCNTRAQVEEAVGEILGKHAEGIVCMDDKICTHVLHKLEMERVKIPRDMKVASFFDSLYLENYYPGITTLKFDVKTLGSTACGILFECIAGRKTPERTLLGYEIIIKDSTKFSNTWL